MHNNIIEARKVFNKTIKAAKEIAKSDTCLCCGKQTKGFCKSHFVPEFILRNIAIDGNVLYNMQILKSPLAKNRMGIGEAGTFYIICDECDGKLFASYEDERQIFSFNSDNKKFMASIALKNYMKQFYKRNYEIHYQDEVSKIAPQTKPFNSKVKDVYKLDWKEYKENLMRALHILERNLKSGYNCIFSVFLNYKSPIAFQGAITLQQDLLGKEINDIYAYDEKIKLQDLHACIFPLSNNQTFVLLFVHKDDTKYKSFIKQFNNLDLANKLKVLNFAIFRHCEDFFISEDIDRSCFTDEFLDICRRNPSDRKSMMYRLYGENEIIFKDIDTIPCLLDEKYAIAKPEDLS